MKIGEEACPIQGTAEEQEARKRLWLRINWAPERIAQAAIALLDVETELESREVTLTDKAAALLTATVEVEGGPAEPLLSGKTEAVRKAQLSRLTEHERLMVRTQQVVVERAKIQLRLEQDRFSAEKALARLLEVPL